MTGRDICGKGSCESCMGMAIPVAEPYEADQAPTTSASYGNYSSGIPYSVEGSQEREGHENDQFLQYAYVGYPSTKKSGFRLEKLYSTRARGRSSPLQCLARKICRFKVRTVLVGGTTATNQTQQTR